jgi:hypothetical protein
MSLDDSTPIPVSDVEARTLRERVQAILHHARANTYDPNTMEWPGEDPEGRFTLEVGPLVCVYFRTMIGDAFGRCLTIRAKGAKGVRDLPPPKVCSHIAEMFGFVGELGIDYDAGPKSCGCAMKCPPIILCSQGEPS